MVKKSVLDTVTAMIKRHEGAVNHLYLDSRGNVTFGYGFRPPLNRYHWHPSLQHAIADAVVLGDMQHDYQKYTARYYKRFTRAYMTPEDMQAVLDQKVAEYARQVDRDWDLARFPECVQIALIDMGYNLGVTKLRGYVKMRAALDAGDFFEAALQSHRGGIGDRRNEETSDLILQAHKEDPMITPLDA